MCELTEKKALMPKANADAKADDLTSKLAAVSEQLTAVTANLAKRDEELKALQMKASADSATASAMVDDLTSKLAAAQNKVEKALPPLSKKSAARNVQGERMGAHGHARSSLTTSGPSSLLRPSPPPTGGSPSSKAQLPTAGHVERTGRGRWFGRAFSIEVKVFFFLILFLFSSDFL